MCASVCWEHDRACVCCCSNLHVCVSLCMGGGGPGRLTRLPRHVRPLYACCPGQLAYCRSCRQRPGSLGRPSAVCWVRKRALCHRACGRCPSQCWCSVHGPVTRTLVGHLRECALNHPPPPPNPQTSLLRPCSAPPLRHITALALCTGVCGACGWRWVASKAAMRGAPQVF
jgi:hypothetical protein